MQCTPSMKVVNFPPKYDLYSIVDHFLPSLSSFRCYKMVLVTLLFNPFMPGQVLDKCCMDFNYLKVTLEFVKIHKEMLREM